MDPQLMPDISVLLSLLTGPPPLQPSEENPEVDDLGNENSEDENGENGEDENGEDSNTDNAPSSSSEENAPDEDPNADIPPLVGARPRVTRPRVAPPLLAAPEQELDLTDCPIKALAVNDLYRRADIADGPKSGLWTLEQWAAIIPRQYKYTAQTFAPNRWPTATPVGQDVYCHRFSTKFPEVDAILKSTENVYAIGGSAAWPLGESSVVVGDCDLFIAGIDPADRVALWRKVAEVTRKVRHAFMGGLDGDNGLRAVLISQTLSPGLVTLTVQVRSLESNRKICINKIQIILRAYPSVSSILHGFDIPACSIAYDGQKTYLTYLAAFTHTFRVIVVWPAYSSTTYSARLLKYFGRGFALAFPHMRRGALVKGTPLRLPRLILHPSIVRGLFAVGTVELPAGEPTTGSDYGPTHIRGRYWSTEPAVWAPMQINLRQLVSGQNRFIVRSVIKREFRQQRWSRAVGGESNKGIPFAKFTTAEPMFADILPRERFEKLLDSAERATVDGRGLINTATLRDVFRLSAAEISRYTVAVSEALARNPRCRLNMSPALAPFRAAVVAIYDATPLDIGWWIVTNPGRQDGSLQHTVSLKPRFETPAEWYGAAYSAGGVISPSADEFIEALLGTLEGRQGAVDGRPVFDGMCPLCLEPLAGGVANSSTLRCGHTFHLSETPEGCLGLLHWAVDHRNCPICRRTFADEPPSTAPSAPATIPINIEW